MAKVHPNISPDIQEWVMQQHLFFVATAPLAADGHVNCSPKGLDCFRILGPQRVAYLDLTGSAAETIAHLRENSRIVFMFCAFSGPPKIVRFHGNGRVVTPESPEWDNLITLFPVQPGTRAVVVAEINRVSDSCGYGVPKYEFLETRDTHTRWATSKTETELQAYRKEKNQFSIDGLPSVDAPE